MNKVLTLITFIGLANFAHADARADYQRQELLEATQAQTKAMQEQAEALSSIAFQGRMNTAPARSCIGEMEESHAAFLDANRAAIRAFKELKSCREDSVLLHELLDAIVTGAETGDPSFQQKLKSVRKYLNENKN